MKRIEWKVVCNKGDFEKCRRDPKFPYIVALARAVNALNTSHSLITRKFKIDTPEAIRNRMNSFFLSSALLYEGLVLVRKMKRMFRGEPAFEDGLRLLLRNQAAQRVERMHLNPARNHAVFHFLPEKFEDAIKLENHPSCMFIAAAGTKNKHVHFSYADVVAAEMLVGISSDKKEFWPAVRNASEETGVLITKFAAAAEQLIVPYLRGSGFYRS